MRTYYALIVRFIIAKYILKILKLQEQLLHLTIKFKGKVNIIYIKIKLILFV